MNFLISLIKETFDEFIAEREYKDRDEVIKIILSFDRLCHVKYQKPKFKYFQYVIQHEKEVPDKKIESLRKKFQKNFDRLEKKVD